MLNYLQVIIAALAGIALGARLDTYLPPRFGGVGAFGGGGHAGTAGYTGYAGYSGYSGGANIPILRYAL